MVGGGGGGGEAILFPLYLSVCLKALSLEELTNFP